MAIGCLRFGEVPDMTEDAADRRAEAVHDPQGAFQRLLSPCRLERFILSWDRLNTGIWYSGRERNPMRCEHRERCATPPCARKTPLKRLRFAQIHFSASSRSRLGGLFPACRVEILARRSCRAAVFSSPARKIPAIKPLPL